MWVAVAVVIVAFVGLGSKFIPSDDPRVAVVAAFDPAEFGVDNFGDVQAAVKAKAVDAVTLGDALATDAAAATSEYSQPSSGGPVFSVTFTGVAGAGQSGVYPVTVSGLDPNLLVRVQTGPAINGTELRDATDKFPFGDFTNQIAFQNAGAALNSELKTQVLTSIDTASLEGKTVTVTGAFTLINPDAWFVTPVQLEVSS
jgi:predicted lipoprotein